MARLTGQEQHHDRKVPGATTPPLAHYLPLPVTPLDHQTC